MAPWRRAGGEKRALRKRAFTLPAVCEVFPRPVHCCAHLSCRRSSGGSASSVRASTLELGRLHKERAQREPARRRHLKHNASKVSLCYAVEAKTNVFAVQWGKGEELLLQGRPQNCSPLAFTLQQPAVRAEGRRGETGEQHSRRRCWANYRFARRVWAPKWERNERRADF